MKNRKEIQIKMESNNNKKEKENPIHTTDFRRQQQISKNKNAKIVT